MSLDRSVTTVNGVGQEVSKKLTNLGIKSVRDLLLNIPRRYEDFSKITPIASIKPGQVTIEATIKQAKGRYVRRGLHITEGIASDSSGSIRLIWFNQPYRAGSIKAESPYFISGLFERRRNQLAISNPATELVSEFPINTARIVPIYKETKGLKSNTLRKIIRGVLPEVSELPESLPNWILSEYHLMARSEAIRQVHFPETPERLLDAQRRLGFEEVFELSLASLLNKYELMQDHSLKVPFNKLLARQFVSHLPFKLTDAQRAVVWRIYQDLERTHPMNRLVEGDVGSGKTVVAAMAALMAMEQGFQVAFMAPTELLARQHAETIQRLLRPLGYDQQVSLLVGSLKPSEKEDIYSKISKGKVRFIIGTHALIQDKVDMHNLGLVIIDEQHRFGVEQRQRLQAKAGHMPHLLSMTATPIPRSLALTLYGELDISIIDVLPKGRQPIITKICSPNSRAQLYKSIDAQLQAGRQMFVVTPLISDSDLVNGPSAEAVYEQLANHDFKHRRVGLLHGKMRSEQKQEVMERFVLGKLDILVATTVIEVGVDVPNATVMLIEGAERFGLAQMHQLRGRIGRGEQQGYCYLMMSDSSAPSRRLQALENSNNGFELAELDMELRGPGAIYGTFQHGVLDLRVAKLSDTKLIAFARQAAQAFIDKRENLLQYPSLASQVTKLRAVTNLS